MFSPRNWRVRSKLAAVLVVPALAFLVLASLNMSASIRGTQEFGQGATIAGFGGQVTSLVHELQAERDLSVGYISAGRPPVLKAVAPDPNNPKVVPRPDNAAALLQAQQQSVNQALGAYRTAQDAVLPDVDQQTQGRIDAARTALEDLGALRNAVSRALLTSAAIFDRYTAIVASLLNVDAEIGHGGGSSELDQSVTALNDLSRAKEAVSQVRGKLYAIAFAQTFQFGQFQELSGAIAPQVAAIARFRADANDQQRTLYDELVNGQAVLAVRRIQDTAVNRQQTANLDIDPAQWYQAANTRIELIRGVESRLLDSVVSQARTLRNDAQRSAVTTGIVIAAILIIALLTSLLIARSMVQPLRRLRTSALDVAENRLPQAIQRLRGGDPGSAEIVVEPIGVDSRDEIGEVAQTFDAIHREAIRLATEQAALRSNVNSMFVNLSRRSQGLVERQLKLIDELETGEQDPDQLSNLFKLDHLATRMRRNSENLLVLAGEDAGRRWGRPIPLVDVLRAATSEVEQYHRVQLTGVPEVEVMGHAVNHVVHLVAELLENATVFSSPESKVLVHSQRLSDGGAMIEIEDRGIGMAAEEIADANERLAHPPVFDVSISRMMGLFVVGRLAARHGITVRLRQSELGGVSAFARLPADMLASRFDQRSEPVGADSGRPGSRGSGQLPPPGPAADLPRRPLPAPGAMPGAPGGVGGPGFGGPGFGGPGFGSPGGGGPAVGAPGVGAPGIGAAGVGPGAFGGTNGPAAPGGPVRPPGGLPPLPRRTPTGVGASDHDSPNGADSNGRDGIAAGPRHPGMPPVPGPNGPRPPIGVPGHGPDVRPGQGGHPRPAAPYATGAPARQLPGRAEQEIRLPIFEQLQSEWFRRRTPAARPAAAGGPQPPVPGAVPRVVAQQQRPGSGQPAAPGAPSAPPAAAAASAGSAGVPSGPGGPVGPRVPAAQAGAPGGAPGGPGTPEVPAVSGGVEPDWQSPADEGWRAAERLLAPTSGGTTRAGLPMRVPQAHLVPGAADTPPVPAPVASPASRSPEAVRSRLASYHQGVRRGRHADRRGESTDRDQPDALVQTQEQT